MDEDACVPVWENGTRFIEEPNMIDSMKVNQKNCKFKVDGKVLYLDIKNLNLETFLDEIKPFEQVPTLDGVYTWIVYSNDERIQQFVASRMLSAFEIGTKHNMLAYRMKADRIHCAGELRIKDGLKEFNFFSGTFMEPFLGSRVKKRSCLREELENFMIDKMKSMFFGNDSYFIERSFIDSSFVPTSTEIELYKKHGAVAQLFDDEASCIKSVSGGKKRTKTLRRVNRKKRNTVRRKRSKF